MGLFCSGFWGLSASESDMQISRSGENFFFLVHPREGVLGFWGQDGRRHRHRRFIGGMLELSVGGRSLFQRSAEQREIIDVFPCRNSPMRNRR